MVVNTARSFAPRISNEADTLLIVDECHRSASVVNSTALQGTPKATLGLSATPEREHDDFFETVLIRTLGPVVFRYDYRDALRDLVIVPFDIVNVAGELTLDEQRKYDVATTDIARTLRLYKDGRVGRDTLARKLRNRASLSALSMQRIPITIRLAEENRGNRILIFHESIHSAETIQKVLSSRNFNTTIYHSKITSEVRRDNLRLYRRGVFDVMVTCRALDEGINVPETSAAIIASSTASVRQRIQRLGRVLRPAPGKEKATVYTIYLTQTEEDRLVREARDLTDCAGLHWMRSLSKSDATFAV
jgi:superfamily II DNA or RNA helicase